MTWPMVSCPKRYSMAFFFQKAPRSIRDRGAFVTHLIEPPHAEIQIGCEGHPNKVGDLQPRGQRVDFAKSLYHP